MISSTGHFYGAIRDLTEKARTTYYMLRNLFTKILQKKFGKKKFDSLLKPILRYGSDVWGTKYKDKLDTWVKATPELFHLIILQEHTGKQELP